MIDHSTSWPCFGGRGGLGELPSLATMWALLTPASGSKGLCTNYLSDFMHRVELLIGGHVTSTRYFVTTSLAIAVLA